MKNQPNNPNDQFDPDTIDANSDDALDNTANVSLEELDDMTNNPPPTIPDESEEESLSGDNAGLETDDDTFKNMQDVGLIDPDADEDEQPELDIAKRIEEAEKAHRES